LEGLADSRFVLVLGELGNAIEASVSVGVPLNGLDNIQYLLDQQQKRDDSILSIDVVDPRGRILFSSQTGRAGETLGIVWDLRSQSSGLLRDRESGTITLGQALVNAFNEPLGVVVLRYSTKAIEATEASVLHLLRISAGFLAILFAFVAWAGFRQVLHGFRRSVSRMSLALEAVLGGAAPDDWRASDGTERHFGSLLHLLHGQPGDDVASCGLPDASGSHARTIVRRMFALAALVLVLPLAFAGFQATQAFQAALVPEMHEKAAALARAVAADLEHAVQVGIPFDALVEPIPYLQDQLTLVPEARYLAVERHPGEILYATGLAASEVARNLAAADPEVVTDNNGWQLKNTTQFSDLSVALSDGLGAVHIGIPSAVLARQKAEIAADVVVLSIAGLLVTFEVLLLAVASGITQPFALLARMVGCATRGDFAVRVTATGRSDLGRLLALVDVGFARLRARHGTPHTELREVRAVNLMFIRTPLFLFCFAEELVRSFLPLYTNTLSQSFSRHLSSPTSVLSGELLVGLPITLFMLVVAVSTPLSAAYSDRVGRRPTLLLGAFISALGLLLAAAPIGYWGLLVCRGVSGIGYAAVFMACQGYVLDNTSSTDRAKGLSLYVGAIAAADLCGPPIGGLLADQIGFPLCFVVASGLVCSAWLLAWWMLQDNDAGRIIRPKVRWSDTIQLVKNRRLMALIFFASIPAKLLLTGFLFYLVPLHLATMHQSPSMVGQVMMIYAAGSLLVGPLAARAIDRWQLDELAVLFGNAVAAASLTLVWSGDELWQVAFAVGGFGIGQAISISCQITVAARYAAAEVERMGAATVISVLRLFERLGAAMGPLIAGTLLTIFGASTAIALLGLGGLALLCMLTITLVFARIGKSAG
jgi:predicted MFS family arabinose efflux permease